jgi:pimeloyl-ACP methyl ester carboxylesterase
MTAENSTNVRSTREAPWFFRTMIRAGAAVLPEATEQYAAKLFITPSLRKGKTPRELHAELLPERAMYRRSGENEPAYPVLPTGRIALWSWGRGPTVLLVHGWSGHAGDMAPLAAEFVRAGYRAVLFDMPGHGGSSPSPTNLFIYLRTIAAVAPLVGPVDTIVGHSLGGTATALALGQRLVQAKRAALLAPAVSPWAFSWHFAQMIGLPAERVPGMVRRTEELVGAKADTLNAAEAVSGLEIPGHIVHDPTDLDVPFEHSAKLTAAWRNATLTARPGLGHRRLLKDRETIEGIVEFVRGGESSLTSPTPAVRLAAR